MSTEEFTYIVSISYECIPLLICLCVFRSLLDKCPVDIDYRKMSAWVGAGNFALKYQ